MRGCMSLVLSSYISKNGCSWLVSKMVCASLSFYLGKHYATRIAGRLWLLANQLAKGLREISLRKLYGLPCRETERERERGGVLRKKGMLASCLR